MFRYMFLMLAGLTITASPLLAEGGRSTVEAGFFKIYDPGVGEDEPWYINDHCFFYGPDGLWHLLGITKEEPADAMREDQFAHATSPVLVRYPWTKQPFALRTDAEWKEDHLWAPHVTEHEGTYYMYYCAGAPEHRHTEYRIHLATSKDMWTWTRHPENPMVVDGFDARDPMILQHGDEWLMYYTANEKPEGGHHLVAMRRSRDLIHWGEREVVFTDPAVGTFGGPCESPFVVRRGKYYYLFIGPREGYVGTDIFQSTTPFQWSIEDKVGHVYSHAAEVIRDLDGKWYVSAAGWGQGGVYLSELKWYDGQDENETSMPIPKKKDVKKNEKE